MPGIQNLNCQNALIAATRFGVGVLGSVWAGRSVQWLYKLWQEAGTERMLTSAGLQAIGTAGLHVVGGLAALYAAYKIGDLVNQNARIARDYGDLREYARWADDADSDFEPEEDGEDYGERYNPRTDRIPQAEVNELLADAGDVTGYGRGMRYRQ